MCEGLTSRGRLYSLPVAQVDPRTGYSSCVGPNHPPRGSPDKPMDPPRVSGRGWNTPIPKRSFRVDTRYWNLELHSRDLAVVVDLRTTFTTRVHPEVLRA